MGIYFRKSIGVGPLRLNLSKSGVGASVGVKGARLGVNSRGAYVHLGRGGVYYRQTLASFGGRSAPAPAAPAAPHPGGWREPAAAHGSVGPFTAVTSGDVGQMADASAADLLASLTEAASAPRRLVLAGVLGSLVVLLLMGVWAGALSPLIRSAGPAAGLGALFGGWVFVIGAFVAVLVAVRRADDRRRSAHLEYQIDAQLRPDLDRLYAGFAEMARCSAVWSLDATAPVYDPKYQAGARSVVERTRIGPGFGLPPNVTSNLTVPVLPAGFETLYFFPDRLLVYAGGRVGAVDYGQLRAAVAQQRFVEEQGAPPDGRVVDSTWRYVNKGGGPDRRFNDNWQLPVMLYETVHLTSPSGLNEAFYFSRPGAAHAFALAVDALRRARSQGERH